MQSITIIGRRWFQRGPGNTYHSATIAIDGKVVGRIPFSWGYGDMYVQNATDWLEANGYMPGREHHTNGSKEPGWQYFREKNGIAWHTEAIDVQRKKDL